ncbi:hypothetical protein HMN09_00095300 [Mycena chlorophos]|uniref:ubiquitinyl hydrolase 1 n=1 Tax=Mycena chlorophos TaxID=658473 RepID=A0A8H6TQ24_MYCCL|nr:hypothetical protein HMN09_00095300 [Mycena chlorophos]
MKRKRDASPQGLNAGEVLQRSSHAISSTSWGWVLSEAENVSEITNDHLLATCGMSPRNTHRFCRNKYSTRPRKETRPDPDDVIVISDDDDDDSQCTKRSCRSNPNCVNYVGQKPWESESAAREMFMEVASLGHDPSEDERHKGVPVGLKNLGATCYANASLQVWFRDIAFRRGVFDCESTEEKFEESPIFQLQVTFAALQCTTQNVFNPEKLVEALELKTTEQQDAQEFSKLFLEHLDAQFQKQSKPALKTLITDQFQGKQVYGTLCSKCQTKSERDTGFLELEISFKNNTKLEDNIANLLREESLSGDNQYFCSNCDGLQDATRYTELASLPPVMHFSLQRFSYNFSTEERVKSKNAIVFPKTLDMSPFLGKAEERNAAATNKSDANVYELRGVLLHKGKSAYHGHYEAQIFDAASSSWFQFNDETVTKIKKLGDKVPTKETVIDIEEEDKKKAPGKEQRENARKRQRVEDSDDELLAKSVEAPASLDPESRISSKDAYMLIYTRKEVCPSPPIPQPPVRALGIVEDLNATHKRACENYAAKEKQANATFQETRRKVQDICRTWRVTGPQEKDFVIVSESALDDFLGEAVIKAATTESETPHKLDMEDIICIHGRYDHHKAAAMKRITRKAYEQIKSLNCAFSHELTSNDVCRECVEETFRTKLYAKQHPKLVGEFDDLPPIASNETAFWISKPWLRDWRLQKPKMTEDGADPSPDSKGYMAHVKCEHGGLALNSTNRCKISAKGVELLQRLYPTWEPLSDDLDECIVCDEIKNASSEERSKNRRLAEEEKASLQPLFDDTSSYQGFLEDAPCALIPSDFLNAWRYWLNKPTERPRPETIDNEPFFCEHRLLAFDPNCEADVDGILTAIRRSDWDELEGLYLGGPLIAVQKSKGSFEHPIKVCIGCREQRKTDWSSTEITIRCEPKEGRRRKTAASFYGPASRQSTRLRQAKENAERTKMQVTKTTTVKDIKVHVQKQLKIATICQRLFYQGKELDDNAATVASLNIYAQSILELKQENEVYEISDSEDVPAKRRRTEEAAGFGGTLLGRSNHRSSSPPTPPPQPKVKTCHTCTFDNEQADATECEMCGTSFGSS